MFLAFIHRLTVGRLTCSASPISWSDISRTYRQAPIIIWNLASSFTSADRASLRKALSVSRRDFVWSYALVLFMGTSLSTTCTPSLTVCQQVIVDIKMDFSLIGVHIALTLWRRNGVMSLFAHSHLRENSCPGILYGVNDIRP